MRVLFFVWALTVGSLALPYGQTTTGQTHPTRPQIIFEGTVVKKGPSPGFDSGISAVYQLVKYKINRVCSGGYDNPEIVIDHLILKPNALKGLKVGDRVFVIAERSEFINTRFNDGVIRFDEDKVVEFFIGKRFFKSPKMTCSHSG